MPEAAFEEVLAIGVTYFWAIAAKAGEIVCDGVHQVITDLGSKPEDEIEKIRLARHSSSTWPPSGAISCDDGQTPAICVAAKFRVRTDEIQNAIAIGDSSEIGCNLAPVAEGGSWDFPDRQLPTAQLRTDDGRAGLDLYTEQPIRAVPASIWQIRSEANARDTGLFIDV